MRTWYTGATIYTMDDDRNVYDVMAVEDGKIARIGVKEELKIPAGEPVVDLAGKFIYPGFNDSHMHLLNCGYTKYLQVVLQGTKSVADLQQRIEAYITDRKLPAGAWVRGRGWNNDYFEDDTRFPTRYDLDKASPHHPMVMTRACGHACVVNSKALEVLGIDKNTPQIPGAVFEVDQNGEPNGVFREQAMDKFIYSNVPLPSPEEVKDMLEKTMQEMNRWGITSAQTDDFISLPGNEYQLVIDAYEALKKEGKLTVRVCSQSQFLSQDLFLQFLRDGYGPGYGDELYKMGPLKIQLDGSLGARSAALAAPYTDDAGNTGIMTMTAEELLSWLGIAKDHGMNTVIHCIGDGAMHRALDCFETLMEPGDANHRNGLIHVQITDLPLLERIADLHVLAYVQPIFLDYDWKVAVERVGKERERTSYNWKTLMDLGVRTSFGTDAPVEHFNPFHNIYEAVTRKDLNGNPARGWLPDQAVTVDEALAAYTREGAFASFEEEIKGTLEVGKLADFIVLDDDLFTMEPEKIKDVLVWDIVLSGNIMKHI